MVSFLLSEMFSLSFSHFLQTSVDFCLFGPLLGRLEMFLVGSKVRKYKCSFQLSMSLYS